MKLKYQGDVMDVVKHWYFSVMHNGIIEKLVVFPMFTETWCGAQKEQYIRLFGQHATFAQSEPLDSKKCWTLNHGKENRKCYFSYGSSCKTHDYFIDPNTGLQLDRKKHFDGRDYVFLPDLTHLLSSDCDHIAFVYDQSLGRGREEEELEEKQKRLFSAGFLSVCYVAQTAIWAIGRSAARDRLLAVFGRLDRVEWLPKSRRMWRL